ncbi:sulfur carrier protein ThiS [Paenibacillus naphthalenovorans]|uniref:sulfur carrier protein ThiS n=1 Tax=Paenibacillus naphthalenovorans TaxID=162209 RepID=UPI000883E121|nr:sulfur carrier protein ThiS [Paenibacillus naphthalenovorans]SDI96727.1 sulfur carrier protein [Paenibacillus naphthalenovorans]
MRLIVNGEPREMDNVSTVAEMLAAFKLENKILVVELNKEIIERGTYNETHLNDGDRVEIVHFVGGG